MHLSIYTTFGKRIFKALGPTLLIIFWFYAWWQH